MLSKDSLNEEGTYELNKIVEMENKLNGDNLVYETSNKKKDKTYDFQMFKQCDLLEEKYLAIIYH